MRTKFFRNLLTLAVAIGLLVLFSAGASAKKSDAADEALSTYKNFVSLCHNQTANAWLLISDYSRGFLCELIAKSANNKSDGSVNISAKDIDTILSNPDLELTKEMWSEVKLGDMFTSLELSNPVASFDGSRVTISSRAAKDDDIPIVMVNDGNGWKVGFIESFEAVGITPELFEAFVEQQSAE